MLLSPLAGKAKDAPKYPVSAIPAELLENVDIVYRKDLMNYRIVDKDRDIKTVFVAITILNPNGKDYAYRSVGYDKLTKVNFIKGAVYDASGNLIRKLKANEIYDRAAFDGVSLYSDNRLKAVNLSHGAYPYTVEFEYEVESKFLFGIPPFIISPKASVEEAEYTMTYPIALKPNYRVKNVTVSPEKKTLSDNSESITWRFKSVKPIKLEPYAPAEEQMAMIMAAPSVFEYEGYGGKMETWDDLGKWIASLRKGRDILPEPTKQKVRTLTANLSTTEEKVKAVYEFVQNKTRYVSIALGIGGLQPFEAKVVDETGYGDCKALSNYTVTLLEAIGIKSHYVLVEAGETPSPMVVDFPSSQFNHIIVCVPNRADTLWLECTSQTNPFGYMGTFTGNRKALAITDEGAKVVNTPVYTERENLQLRKATVSIGKDGNGTAKVTTRYTGTQYENDDLNFVITMGTDRQQKWIQETTDIPTFDVASFKMTNQKERNPTAIVDVTYKLPRLCAVSGKRLFLLPNLMNKSTYVPDKVENRKSNITIRNGYTDIDTIEYEIPEELYPEYMPEPVKITSRFGEYEASFKLDQGKLVYIRKKVFRKGTYPPDSYQEFIDFYKQTNRADAVKMVFLSKT
jgi:hypothetical protein